MRWAQWIALFSFPRATRSLTSSAFSGSHVRLFRIPQTPVLRLPNNGRNSQSLDCSSFVFEIDCIWRSDEIASFAFAMRVCWGPGTLISKNSQCRLENTKLTLYYLQRSLGAAANCNSQGSVAPFHALQESQVSDDDDFLSSRKSAGTEEGTKLFFTYNQLEFAVKLCGKG